MIWRSKFQKITSLLTVFIFLGVLSLFYNNCTGTTSFQPIQSSVGAASNSAAGNSGSNSNSSTTSGSTTTTAPDYVPPTDTGASVTTGTTVFSAPSVSYKAASLLITNARPYISLASYKNAASSLPTAYARLKNLADSKVSVINQYASASFATLSANLDYGFSCTDLLIVYSITNNSSYINACIKYIDAFIDNENTYINVGKAPVIASDSYLEVGDYMEQIALTYDYGFSLLTSAQKIKWQTYANQAIYNVWNPNSARWGTQTITWSGWSINDPGNNYYYSFNKATELWALANQDASLVSFLQTSKFPQMISYFSQFVGGGSREGTGYGTAQWSNFENMNYWKNSTTEDLSAYSTHATSTIEYWIHATVPNFYYFASIGDQARNSMPIMFDYQRKLMLLATALNPNAALAKQGKWWLNHAPVTDGGTGWEYGQVHSTYAYRFDLLASSFSGVTEQAPTKLVYLSPAAGALFARSDWTTGASWFATIAGIYDQSHAHQDQGSFQFYKNDWLSVTSNTLSISGIEQTSDVHNIIRFEDANGNLIPQNNATSVMTYDDKQTTLNISQDLTPVYSNNKTKVKSWKRDMIYDRTKHSVYIHDLCSIDTSIKPVFQIHVPTLPTINANVIKTNNLTITQNATAGTLIGTPKIIDMRTVLSLQYTDDAACAKDNPVPAKGNCQKMLPAYSSGYRIELTASTCEFKVLLQAN